MMLKARKAALCCSCRLCRGGGGLASFPRDFQSALFFLLLSLWSSVLFKVRS